MCQERNVKYRMSSMGPAEIGKTFRGLGYRGKVSGEALSLADIQMAGVRVKNLPITAEKIYLALDDAKT